MSDQVVNENLNAAKTLGKSMLAQGMNTMTGKNSDVIITFFVYCFRFFGLAVFISALFGMLGFDALWEVFKNFSQNSAFVAWLKTTVIGAVLGTILFVVGEVVNLIAKIERHLREIVSK